MQINMEFPQKIQLPYDQLYNSWTCTQRNQKSACNRDTCTPIHIEAVFTIVKLLNQSRCPSIDERIRTLWEPYGRNKILSLTGKMDGTRDLHVKFNKLHSERQVLHIFYHMQNPDLKIKNKAKKI
jgi:hypothetical protein